MKRLIVTISIISCLFAGCGNPASNSLLVDDSLYMGPYDIDPFFGYYGDSEWLDNKVPDIDGLVYRTTIPIHMGVRCPSDKALLSWAAGKLDEFTEWSIKSPYDSAPKTFEPCKAPESAEDLIDHYMGILDSKPVDHLDPEIEESAIEQFGILLTDIWRSKKYCTMQEVIWYDFFSNGDNTKRSWFTIDLNTGEELTFDDIVRADCRDAFVELLLKHLRNHSELWSTMYGGTLSSPDSMITTMSGCALLEEGLVCYYHPYEIGCGADGQFNAVIPYSEVQGLLNIRRP